MNFADNKFRHKNLIALSFSKPFYHEPEKVAELAEEVFNECFELYFTRLFSSSVQDLATSDM